MKVPRILLGVAIAPLVAALAIGALITLATRIALDLLLPGGSLQGPEIERDEP